jgi:outer membrane protein OmpA-like peptidoglycan-associated protein
VLRSDLAFGYDSAKVSSRAKTAVEQVAEQAKRAHLESTILVDGYTDNQGSAA